MTNLTMYYSDKALGVITDSQGTAGNEKDDSCQKLFDIGGNFLIGTGLSVILHNTAMKLDTVIGSQEVKALDLVGEAFPLAVQEFEQYPSPTNITNIYICGKDDSEFAIYGILLGMKTGPVKFERIMIDGSGAEFVANALERDYHNGINPFIYENEDEIMSFLYDTAIEGARSIGVNLTFQMGLMNEKGRAALYDPKVRMILPPDYFMNDSSSLDMEIVSQYASGYAALNQIAEERYKLKSEFNRIKHLEWYNEKSKKTRSLGQIIKELDGLKNLSGKVVNETLGLAQEKYEAVK